MGNVWSSWEAVHLTHGVSKTPPPGHSAPAPMVPKVRAHCGEIDYVYWGDGGVIPAYALTIAGRSLATVNWYSNPFWLNNRGARAGVTGTLGRQSFTLQFSREGWRTRLRALDATVGQASYSVRHQRRWVRELTRTESDQCVAVHTDRWRVSPLATPTEQTLAVLLAIMRVDHVLSTPLVQALGSVQL